VPGVTINRLCGSGLEAVASGARLIKTGEAELVMAGGVESMSRAPFVMGKSEMAFARDATLFDTTMGWRFVNPELARLYGSDAMPVTAENVAREYAIRREHQDEFALRSQQRAAEAAARGFFAREIVPVKVQGRKPDRYDVIHQDEHPRPDATLEGLSALPTPFRENGTVTAGNASGINDGACALLLASAEAAEKYELRPRARILHTTCTGVAPRVMGIGPAPASEKILVQSGLSLDQMDTIELNEAFAAQALAVTRLLGLADDCARVNPNGGAIALGHPLGMSGARLVTTAVNQLDDINGRFALCTMCIGVGQGIAMIIERV
jgi:acetyl-CoA acyltransferase